MPSHVRLSRPGNGFKGDTGGIGHLPRATVFLIGHQRGKSLIYPFDHAVLRTKIDRQLQIFQHNCANATVHRLLEQFHLSLAETIDGLHRIADQEQRSAIGGTPAAREFFKQFGLRNRGILEFVHQ